MLKRFIVKLSGELKLQIVWDIKKLNYLIMLVF